MPCWNLTSYMGKPALSRWPTAVLFFMIGVALFIYLFIYLLHVFGPFTAAVAILGPVSYRAVRGTYKFTKLETHLLIQW